MKDSVDLAAAQREHWQRTYATHPGMYGQRPSEPAGPGMLKMCSLVGDLSS
ncbi:hypothetical protein [Sphaerisporangium sp. NPDC051011]|uniref:hypothetical protein n=1 Tax=Sphaerisporangium sp. NPDC051011 TaxID=3155792 RepID=UPI0033C057BA